MGTTVVGTPVVCGWQTSLVQVTVWVTVMLLVPVVTEVRVLDPEVMVVVPTGHVVVTKVMVLVVIDSDAGAEGATVVGPTVVGPAELGTGVPVSLTTGTVPDPGADSEGVTEVGPTEEGVPVTGMVTGTVLSPGAGEVTVCGWQTSLVQVTV